MIRKVRAKDAKAHKSLTIHIHVDAAKHNTKSLSILAKMVHKNDEMIFDALQVHPDRHRRYARLMDDEFINKTAQHRPQLKQKLNEMGFWQHNPNPAHFEGHRYHGLNPNNLWRSIGTVELRYFNSTL